MDYSSINCEGIVFFDTGAYPKGGKGMPGCGHRNVNFKNTDFVDTMISNVSSIYLLPEVGR
jgi:hypothetical protein